MTEADPIVFVVDDDPSIRDALTSLIRSVGRRGETCAGAESRRG
jgi:FixJ family two-component response regulator